MTVPLLRQSERAVFKRCQWAWYQEYVKCLRPIVERADAADFGTLGHICLAEYYTGPGDVRGPHPAETWERVAGEVRTNVRTMGEQEQIAKWEDFYELGIELLDAYVEKYQGDPHWDVIVDGAERRFNVLIPDVSVPRQKSNKGRRIYKPIVRLVGTMDLCVRDLNQEHKGKPVVKMVDHKFLGRILETDYLTLDEQPSTYICVATHVFQEQGLIGKDEAVKGMEYNFVKRAKLDMRLRDERGVARNNPQKKHYLETFWAYYRDYGGEIEPPKGLFADNQTGTRWSVGDMAELAVKLGMGPVYGEESADQSSDNFKRVFVPRTPAERQRQIVRISEEARVMDMIRTGQLPILKTPTKTCLYCKFFDMCELDEGGQLDDYFVETTMKQGFDPYADHREDAPNSKKVTTDGRKTEGQGLT